MGDFIGANPIHRLGHRLPIVSALNLVASRRSRCPAMLDGFRCALPILRGLMSAALMLFAGGAQWLRTVSIP